MGPPTPPSNRQENKNLAFGGSAGGYPMGHWGFGVGGCTPPSAYLVVCAKLRPFGAFQFSPKLPPPFRNSAASPKVHFKPPAGQWAWARGQCGPIIVRGVGEGAPPLSSRWRARPRTKISAHPFVRRQQRSNKSVAICRTRCAYVRQGAGAHGGCGCSWGFAKVTQGTHRAQRL